MKNLDRRQFLKIVGIGSGAAAAGAMIPNLGMLRTTGPDVLAFRAVAGLPGEPMPAYASYVIEGSLNLKTRTGLLTKTVYAGDPEAMSTIALPGLSRVVRITDVRDLGERVFVEGVIDDPSQLVAGETAQVWLQVDRSAGIAQASFLGREVMLRLQA